MTIGERSLPYFRPWKIQGLQRKHRWSLEELQETLCSKERFSSSSIERFLQTVCFPLPPPYFCLRHTSKFEFHLGAMLTFPVYDTRLRCKPKIVSVSLDFCHHSVGGGGGKMISCHLFCGSRSNMFLCYGIMYETFRALTFTVDTFLS